MRVPRKVFTGALVLAALAALAVTAAPAGASPAGLAPARSRGFVPKSHFPECTQNVTNTTVCLDNFTGGGLTSPVRLMPPAYVANEDFVLVQVTGRCDGGVVTATCPFRNTYFDRYYQGSEILQLDYAPGGTCLATSSTANAHAVIGTCNDPDTGAGGSTGTLFVGRSTGPNPYLYLINVYWTGTSTTSNAACMQANDGTGAASSVYLDRPTGQGCQRWADFFVQRPRGAPVLP